MLYSLIVQIQQKYPVEVIIVDDGSDYGTDRYIASLSETETVNYVKLSRGGRSRARNAGILKSFGDLLIFVDDDVILSKDFVNKHMRAQKEMPGIHHGLIYELPIYTFFSDPGGGHPEENSTYQVSDRRTSSFALHGNIEDILQKVNKLKKISDFESILQHIYSNENLSRYRWFGFTGGNVSIPRVFLENMLFDPDFHLNWGCEDFELGYRLHKLSIPFFYLNEAYCYHLSHKRTDFVNSHQSNADIFNSKHKIIEINLFQEFVSGNMTKDQFIGCLEEIPT